MAALQPQESDLLLMQKIVMVGQYTAVKSVIPGPLKMMGVESSTWESREKHEKISGIFVFFFLFFGSPILIW